MRFYPGVAGRRGEGIPLLATPVETAAGLEPAFRLDSYYPALVYAAVIVGVAASIVAATHVPFLKPRRERNKQKLMPYESGMDPIGSARMQFDVKFYLIAILFLVFDVELLFLYPWAVTAYSEHASPAWRAEFGRVVFVEILIFIGTLALGYVYAWRKGVFRWR